jgi:cephalosporin hydroxylase
MLEKLDRVSGLKQRLSAIKSELKSTQQRLRLTEDEFNRFVQREVAREVATQWTSGRKVLAEIQRLKEDGLLKPRVLPQKPQHLLALYRRIYESGFCPAGILEIGVKNGGSLALWRALFPEARIVGVDLNIDRSIKHDGIAYVGGDQRDTELLQAIGRDHGPFDLIIDDGSHVPADQFLTLRTLLEFAKPGALYIVEDIDIPKSEPAIDHCAWSDLVDELFCLMNGRQRHESGTAETQRLASLLSTRIDEASLAWGAVVFRIARSQ